MFVGGVSIPRIGPISGRVLYSAEEYLKMDKYKITGRLKRELEELEKKYMKSRKNYDYLIVDGPFLAYRSYNAPYRLITSTGLNATMLHGFLTTLNSLRKKFNPRKVIVAWESKGTQSWRKKEYPDYKKRSNGKTKAFWADIKLVQTVLYLLNIKQYFSPENEADDVIGHIVKNKGDNSRIVIFTADKDLMQLITDNHHIYNGKSVVTPEYVKKKFNVKPNQIPDLLAIWGDKADNIEGINGYGLKKASQLIDKYGNVENISKDDTVYKYMSRMLFNKKLVTLNYKCQLREIPNKKFQTDEKLEDILDKYELTQIKENLDEYMVLGDRGGIDKWI